MKKFWKELMRVFEIPFYFLVIVLTCALFTVMFPQSPFNYVCNEEILTLQEVKDIKHAGTFSEQHNYYFVFTTGDTLQVYDDGKVATAEEGNQYKVMACRGTGRNEITRIIERIER